MAGALSRDVQMGGSMCRIWNENRKYAGIEQNFRLRIQGSSAAGSATDGAVLVLRLCLPGSW
jgi:hypothetical protein